MSPRTDSIRTSTAALGLLVFAAGCQSESKPSGPAPSRVQAVVAATTDTASPASVAKPTIGAEPGTASGIPKPRKPRPPLCAGQLEGTSQTFSPKRPPERVKAKGDDLPASPLAADGKRWTWINLWAAWCAPCKEELPLLLEWQAEFGDKLHFAFVSLDDDERQLMAFLNDQPASGLGQSYWLPDGAARLAWLDAIDLNAEPDLPLQVLVDPSGRRRCIVQGAIEREDRAALQRIVSGK